MFLRIHNEIINLSTATSMKVISSPRCYEKPPMNMLEIRLVDNSRHCFPLKHELETLEGMVYVERNWDENQLFELVSDYIFRQENIADISEWIMTNEERSTYVKLENKRWYELSADQKRKELDSREKVGII